ncbi:MAG: ZIP family metal transporter [Candidatus Woesearchaeota archaeon]
MEINILLYIIIATLVVSSMSFIAAWFLKNKATKYLHYLITFAASVLLASAFFDLIPEGLHDLDIHTAMIFILTGIILFFLIERYIHWHHCGKKECHKKSIGMLNLIGDSVHNFLDGVIIAGSFLINPITGIFTSIAIAAHELPQEVGDYSILRHSGFSHKKALKFNVLVSLTALIGGIFGFFLLNSFEVFLPHLVLITAGGFMYIALSDIFPDLHEHKEEKKIILETLILIITIIIFWFLFQFLGHAH